MRLRAVMVAAACLLAVAGCGDDDGGGSGSFGGGPVDEPSVTSAPSAPSEGPSGSGAPSTGPTAPSGSASGSPAASAPPTDVERTPHDPPLVFDTTPVAQLPSDIFDYQSSEGGSPQAVLSEGTVVAQLLGSGDEPVALQAYDPFTGERLWAVEPKREIYSGLSVGPPLVVGEGDDRIAYGAFAGVVPGSGTTPDHPALEVIAVDVESAEELWRSEIDVETDDPESQSDMAVRVPTATDDAVVVTYYAEYYAARTYVIDTDTHEVAWKKDNFRARVTNGDVIVGIGGIPEPYEPTVLKAFKTDGSDAWTKQTGDLYVSSISDPAGDVSVVFMYDYSSGDDKLQLRNVATGDVVYNEHLEETLGTTEHIDCYFDQEQFIVCDGDGRLLAFDVTDIGEKPLWEKREGNNWTAPRVTAVYHGVVYGVTTNGPVTIDAATGDDRPDPPGIAPRLVDMYVGIAASSGGVEGGGTYVPIK